MLNACLKLCFAVLMTRLHPVVLICSLALVQPALSRLPGACLLELSQPRNQHFQQELNDIIEPGGGTAAAAGDNDASFWVQRAHVSSTMWNQLFLFKLPRQDAQEYVLRLAIQLSASSGLSWLPLQSGTTVGPFRLRLVASFWDVGSS
ncbi:hypothetical protein B0H19DRAFT_1072106 [Mycena capillaripes]|nr:hypothetical protein B0H19DRAFT_1072106 [Mycena capillaripes]